MEDNNNISNTVTGDRECFLNNEHLDFTKYQGDMTTEEIKKLNLAFGENLQKIRNQKKISLLQLSYSCSIDDSKISKIEHGRFNIKLSTVFELAKGLGIPPRKLFDFEFEMEE